MCERRYEARLAQAQEWRGQGQKQSKEELGRQGTMMLKDVPYPSPEPRLGACIMPISSGCGLYVTAALMFCIGQDRTIRPSPLLRRHRLCAMGNARGRGLCSVVAASRSSTSRKGHPPPVRRAYHSPCAYALLTRPPLSGGSVKVPSFVEDARRERKGAVSAPLLDCVKLVRAQLLVPPHCVLVDQVLGHRHKSRKDIEERLGIPQTPGVGHYRVETKPVMPVVMANGFMQVPSTDWGGTKVKKVFDRATT